MDLGASPLRGDRALRSNSSAPTPDACGISVNKRASGYSCPLRVPYPEQVPSPKAGAQRIGFSGFIPPSCACEPTVRFAFVVNFLSRCVIAHIGIFSLIRVPV
jgi:hypothetical protein